MATTVQQLITQLESIENKEQPVIFQYYLAKHFEYADGTPNPTEEQFERVVDEIPESGDYHLWSSAYELLNDAVYELIVADEEAE